MSKHPKQYILESIDKEKIVEKAKITVTISCFDKFIETRKSFKLK